MINKTILSFFGIGYIPRGADILIVIIGVFTGLTLLTVKGPLYLIALLLFSSLYGIYASEKYIRKTNEHNPEFIVIDEVIGVWFAILISYSFLDLFSSDKITIQHLTEYIVYVLIVFFVYYLLVSLKPGFIGQIEEEGDGGLSVIGDDLVTGILAGVLIPILMGGYYALMYLL